MKQQRRRARPLVALVGVCCAVALAGCLPLPPAINYAPEPSPLADPTTPPQPEPTPIGELEPADDTGTTPQDGFTNDTGEPFAGEPPLLHNGALPDPPVDVVLEPTRGEPLITPGTPWGLDTEADPYLPDVEPTVAGDLMQSTVGQLLFHRGSSEYLCSATVINSDSGDILITAAHCLWDDDNGQYYTDVSFAPAYEDGDDPFGTWAAVEIWVPSQYQQNSNDSSFDYGFVKLETLDGEHIEDVVGGQGVSFTGETNGAAVVGYPADPPPYDGEIQRSCSDDQLDYVDDGNSSGVYGFECTIGGGASGSGVVSNLDPETGAGTIVSVISYGPVDYTYCPVLASSAYQGLLGIDN